MSEGTARPPSRGLKSQMAGSQSSWLDSQLKPWLRITDVLWWMRVASHGLQIQTKKLATENQTVHVNFKNTVLLET